ncbi:hypothetical protein SODALDRAFT_378305 [Sodiomyces alkalinus F11]|uniref:Imidazoleglycerol-phosphate dehydratase n=1 Tax=Sodiomyces alkalinus (strain CBS 110278 / VKM F-3762 / F11) TaxID=1314773 RepID=A0A3N2PXJ9_SODAK|nr:hypothetical protein SODALDRAFT_378305 [Sodiomyces alkalinus F11]ROT39198.1 hypothetical protein SODALDRAFT_378305 [Sodiomyces alkalinus F11]
MPGNPFRRRPLRDSNIFSQYYRDTERRLDARYLTLNEVVSSQVNLSQTLATVIFTDSLVYRHFDPCRLSVRLLCLLKVTAGDYHDFNMRSHDWMNNEDVDNAAWAATRGGLVGAAKWGALFAVLGGIGHVYSPLYRGLTIQFKIYIQSSAMIVGGVVEADYRLREYEAHMRMQRRILKERAKWQRYEQEFLESKDGGEKRSSYIYPIIP